MGLLSPTEGEIYVNDEKINNILMVGGSPFHMSSEHFPNKWNYRGKY